MSVLCCFHLLFWRFSSTALFSMRKNIVSSCAGRSSSSGARWRAVVQQEEELPLAKERLFWLRLVFKFKRVLCWDWACAVRVAFVPFFFLASVSNALKLKLVICRTQWGGECPGPRLGLGLYRSGFGGLRVWKTAMVMGRSTNVTSNDREECGIV